ncbi:MAG: right-handed parallel beta-helix repeat-containing protein [Ruminococcus sp.]|nr:right-handed parallel beta-helix repeat-containing protein [Ruminococcus sp.]
MKLWMKSCLSLLLVLSLLFSAAVYAGAAATEDEAATPDQAEPGFIYVSEAAVSSRGFYAAVQSALYEARDNATADDPYTVVAPEGSYDLSYVLRVYSNTTLALSGVTLKRAGAGAGNMLRVGDEDGENTGVTGYAYENVRVLGGTFDGNMGENTIIKAFHTKNFSMIGVTLLNEKEGHMTEFAGVDGLTIRGCTFKDQLLTPGNYGYEAIQLDVLHPFHITNGRCEDLPVSNVLIEYCAFENMPRAIGSHTAVHNRPHDKITIRNNSFTDMSSIAIQGMNWTNVDIYGNVIVNAPRGITIYAEPGGCTYLSSKLAAKGGTQSHASDSYQTPPKANIEIHENVLINIGSTDDKYASYSSQGIAVLGEKLTSKMPVDGNDESGGLPAGDYYIDGVKIHDNYIDVRGNGIRVEDARGVKIIDNSIICTKNTVHKDNYYGIVLRSNVTASDVSYNYILGAEVNGIQLDGTNGGSVGTVKYNRIEYCGKYGIGAYTMKFTNIYDNDIVGTKNIGLFMADNSTASEVKWNRIRDCSQNGIWITSNSKASLVESNTTVNCSGSNSYGGSTVKSNYTSGASLTSFHIPWYYETPRKGATLGVGRSFKITPDVRPTNALTSFTYSSSDESVVLAFDTGMIYGVGEGKATITVKSDNGVTKQYPVTVEGDGAAKQLTAEPAAPVLILGDADGSGVVDSIDTALIQRVGAGMDVPYSLVTLSHADVDSDDYLTILDVTYIQCYLANISTPYKIGEAF